MARKSKKSAPPLAVVGAIVLLLLAFAAAFYYISSDSSPFRSTENLDVDSYLQNANSLRGNTYRMEAEVLNQLAMTPSFGRLISVRPLPGRILPLLLPPSFNPTNIQKGQKFVFLVKIDETGLLQVLDLKKS